MGSSIPRRVAGANAAPKTSSSASGEQPELGLGVERRVGAEAGSKCAPSSFTGADAHKERGANVTCGGPGLIACGPVGRMGREPDIGGEFRQVAQRRDSIGGCAALRNGLHLFSRRERDRDRKACAGTSFERVAPGTGNARRRFGGLSSSAPRAPNADEVQEHGSDEASDEQDREGHEGDGASIPSACRAPRPSRDHF